MKEWFEDFWYFTGWPALILAALIGVLTALLMYQLG